MVDVTSLEARIGSALADWTIPGGAVTVVKDGETAIARGFGVRQVGTDAAVDAHTGFAIGSCTKSVTAVALAILVDEGKLSWDDPIIRYLPDFALYDPWITEHVTVRDALAHRIGQRRNIRIYLKGDAPKTEIVHRMRYMQPQNDFRADFRYGNTQYTLAGQLVEAVSGQTWADFVRERIFAPLRMTESYTSYARMCAGTDNYTAPHAVIAGDALLDAGLMRGEQGVVAWQDIGDESAGSVITSAADMAGWLRMLLNEGAPILSAETLRAMHHPQIAPLNYAASEFAPFALLNAPTHFYAYGLGFYLFDYRGHKTVVGGGQIQGMNAVFATVPALRLGVSVMVNTNATFAHFGVLLTIFDAYMVASDRDWNRDFLGLADGIHQQTAAQMQGMIDARQADIPPALPLDAYAGVYHSDLNGDMTISVKDGGLHLYYGPGYSGTLAHWQGDSFALHLLPPLARETDLVTFQIEAGAAVAFTFMDGTRQTKK